MSFLRHGEIYRPMLKQERPAHDRPQPHRYDEFPAGYSLAGCAPAEPVSASPAVVHSAAKTLGSTIKMQRTANHLLTACLTQGDNLKLFRDWQENTNSIFCFRPLAGLRQQMDVWF
jgi:hypothetical protein